MKTLAAAAIALTTVFAGSAMADKTKPVKGQETTSQVKEAANSRAATARPDADARYVDPNARTRELSPELANWLNRAHSRPAGR